MDVFNLAAKLTLDTDEYDRGLGSAESKFSVFGDVLKGNLATEVITKGLDLVAEAAQKAAEGLYNLVKDSVMEYAEYEQLVGGVQKLYGNMGMSLEEYAAQQGKSTGEVLSEWRNLENAQNLVMENAKNAYKTSGMSMNEYMESATSFSASLINSLGGDTIEAANLTDVAMQAIADNFNTFGGDIGMIQGAFQGFAKQNYTMLDNLKLGYGGTKTEMERLIADANEYAESIGESGDLTIDSFADIIRAIDLVQRKQNIYGTTARESSKTIQGSLQTTKAAWKNLLTAMGSGEDIDEAFNNFIESFQTTVDNIIPVIERVIPAIGRIIEKIAPLVEEYLPQLIEKVSPLVMDAIRIIGGALLDLLGELLPEFGAFLLEKLIELGEWLYENVPFIQYIVDFITSAIELFTGLYNSIVEIFTPFAETISGFFSSAWEAIKVVWDVVSGYFETVWETIKTIFSVVKDVFTGDFQGAWDGIQEIVDKWEKYFSDIWGKIKGVFKKVDEWFSNKFGDAWDKIKQVIDLWIGYFQNIWESIKLIFSVVQDVLSGDFQGAWDKIKEIIDLWEGYFSDIWQAIKDIFSGVADWFKEKFDDAWQKIKDAFDTAKEFFEGIWEDIKGVFQDVADWFREKFEAVWDAIKKPFDTVGEFFGGIKEKIMGYFEFGDAKEKGQGLLSNFTSGVNDSNTWNWLTGSLSSVADWISWAFGSGNASTWGSDLMANFVNGIYGAWGWLTDACSSIANTISSWIGFSEPDEGPLSRFHTFAPDMMELFVQGIKDNEDMLRDQIGKSFDFEDLINRGYEIDASVTDKRNGSGRGGAEPVSMTFNVYATERQDAEEVAREVQRVFLQWEGQRKAAYA